MSKSVTIKGWAILPKWGYRTFCLTYPIDKETPEQVMDLLYADMESTGYEKFKVISVSETVLL